MPAWEQHPSSLTHPFNQLCALPAPCLSPLVPPAKSALRMPRPVSPLRQTLPALRHGCSLGMGNVHQMPTGTSSLSQGELWWTLTAGAFCLDSQSLRQSSKEDSGALMVSSFCFLSHDMTTHGRHAFCHHPQNGAPDKLHTLKPPKP